MQHRRRTLLGSLLFASLLVWTSTVDVNQILAQPSCRFVLGFADLAATLGPSVVGVCRENQRTITGPETVDLGGMTLTLPAGTAVQRTTNGVLTWSPVANRSSFRDSWGERFMTSSGLVERSWDDVLSQAGVSPAPAPPSPAQPSPSAQCGALALELTEDAPRTRTERLTAVWGPDDVTTAAEDLCEDAAALHGARGVACFEAAFAAARGRERLFPGQGWAAYDSAYDRCIAAR